MINANSFGIFYFSIFHRQCIAFITICYASKSHKFWKLKLDFMISFRHGISLWKRKDAVKLLPFLFDWVVWEMYSGDKSCYGSWYEITNLPTYVMFNLFEYILYMVEIATLRRLKSKPNHMCTGFFLLADNAQTAVENSLGIQALHGENWEKIFEFVLLWSCTNKPNVPYFWLSFTLSTSLKNS